MVKDLGISTGVDIEKVVDIAFWISSILGRKPASRVATALGAKASRKPIQHVCPYIFIYIYVSSSTSLSLLELPRSTFSRFLLYFFYFSHFRITPILFLFSLLLLI